MKIHSPAVGIAGILGAYSVILWQYLGIALYQKIGLVTISVVFLSATVLLTLTARVLLGTLAATKPWLNILVAVWILVAAVLYFGAFGYSACYFPNAANAARCTLQS